MVSDYSGPIPAAVDIDQCSGPASGRLRDALGEVLARPDAPPGGCLAIVEDGWPSVACAGVAQAFDDRGPLADPPPFEFDTPSDIGSVTKLIGTTTALATLVAAGAVDLDRRLGDLVGAAAGTPAGEATLATLLEHRAGLWEWWPLYLQARDAPSALLAAARRPLRHEPGTGRHYSDLGFMLLGAAVSAVSGSELDAALRRLVFEPFGVPAVRFGAPAAGTPPVAASSPGDWIERRMIETGDPYPVTGDPATFPGWRGHVLAGEVNDGNAFHAFGSRSGHAGLFASARDLLRVAERLLLSVAGTGPLPPSTLVRFLTVGADSGQALGFRRWSTAAGDAYGHTGFPGVAMAIIPERRTGIVLVTNRLHVGGEPAAMGPMWDTALAAVTGGRR